jgi:hypothetical protein
MPRQRRTTSSQLLAPLEALDLQVRRDLGDGEEADHTPIIITGDSVKIDLSSQEYSPISGVYTSAGLDLHLIEGLHATHADGSRLCYFVRPGEVCTVVFHCKRASFPDRNVLIHGGLTTSPTVIFDFVEYGEDTTAPGNRKVHANANRKITAMEILRIRDGRSERVHVCPLIPANGKCQYRIWDPHFE